jgi:hypothetical protein
MVPERTEEDWGEADAVSITQKKNRMESFRTNTFGNLPWLS